MKKILCVILVCLLMAGMCIGFVTALNNNREMIGNSVSGMGISVTDGENWKQTTGMVDIPQDYTMPSEQKDPLIDDMHTVPPAQSEPDLPHLCKHENIYAEIHEAGCTEEGLYKECCDQCGKVFIRYAIPARGHMFGDYVIIQKPTEDKCGVRVRTCCRCDYQEAEEYT